MDGAGDVMHGPPRESSVIVPAVGAYFVAAALFRSTTGVTVDRVGLPITVVLLVFLAAGGLLIIVGCLWRGKPHIARAVERSGHYLAAAAWAALALAMWSDYSGLSAIFGTLQGLVLVIGTLARAQALRRIDRAVSVARRIAGRGDPE